MDDEENLEEQVEPVDVAIEEPTDEAMMEEPAPANEDNFFENLSENMDDRVLTAISSDLITEFKKDKESRSDWEKSYTSGLDLLGFKYSEDGQPFKGASGVTHPLLSEAVTQY